MKLHEYQAKEIFAKYGLPVTPGQLVKHLSEVDEALRRFPEGPWVVKAQIHAGGRGKAGGVKLAKTEADLRQKASDILGMTLISPQTGPQGKIVKKIFITPALDYVKELYVSVVLDRGTRCPVILASSEGGTEIEELAATKPEAIQKTLVNPLQGLEPYQARELYLSLGLPKERINAGAKFFQDLVKIFLELDLAMLEVNPLVALGSGEMHCLGRVKWLLRTTAWPGIKITKPGATRTRKTPGNWKRARAVFLISPWTVTSAVSSMGRDWPWPPPTPSLSSADRRRTFWTWAAAPPPKRSPRPLKSSCQR